MFRIGLGQQGSVDCTLVLSREGETKEYGIDSPAWTVLAWYWETPNQRMAKLTEVDEYILQIVWDSCDKDLV